MAAVDIRATAGAPVYTEMRIPLQHMADPAMVNMYLTGIRQMAVLTGKSADSWVAIRTHPMMAR